MDTLLPIQSFNYPNEKIDIVVVFSNLKTLFHFVNCPEVVFMAKGKVSDLGSGQESVALYCCVSLSA